MDVFFYINLFFITFLCILFSKVYFLMVDLVDIIQKEPHNLLHPIPPPPPPMDKLGRYTYNDMNLSQMERELIQDKFEFEEFKE